MYCSDGFIVSEPLHLKRNRPYLLNQIHRMLTILDFATFIFTSLYINNIKQPVFTNIG